MSLFNQMPKTSKKLVLVSATSMSMTKATKKDKVILEKIPYIHYPLCFCKDKKNKVQTLINSGNKINIMNLRHIAKIGLKICSTNIKAQKIDDSILQTSKIVWESF